MRLDRLSGQPAAWIIFMVSPLVSLFLGFANAKENWGRNVLWGFVTFYGFNFVIYDELMDANRYVSELQNLHEQRLNLVQFLILFFSDNGSSFLDLGAPLLTYMVSWFTSSPQVLFGCYAGVFGFFYSRNLWLLLREIKSEQQGLLVFVLLISLAIMVPFWSINGFRFWTASHIFLYGILRYVLGKQENLQWKWGVLAVAFHFSFIVPLIATALVHGFPRKLNYAFGIYVFSFFFDIAAMNPLKELLLNLSPAFLHVKLNSYLNEDYAQRLGELAGQTKWFVVLGTAGWKYLVFLWLTLVFILRHKILELDRMLVERLVFIMLFGAFFNMLSFIPSMGRFLVIFHFMALCWLGQLFSAIKPGYAGLNLLKFSVFVTIPVIAGIGVYAMRIGLQSINSLVVYGNPLISLWIEGESLLDLIKK